MRFPDDVPTLTNSDVTLRAHRLEDVPGIVEQCTDPISLRWTSVPAGYTAEMGRSWVSEAIPAGWADDSDHCFAIESTHPDGVRRFSGSLSLRDRGGRLAEIAFGAHPAVRGRGVMTTASNLLLDWGFDRLDLESVIWLAERGNFGSRRVAWKTGFTFGGILRRWLDHRGEFPDAWSATLHRDDPRTPTQPWLDLPLLADHDSGVVVRPQHDDDVDRIIEGCNDEQTAYWLGFLPAPYAASDARAYLRDGAEGAAGGELLQWTVTDHHDRLLGVVGLPRMKPGAAEVGYWTHPDARGRGVATAAVRLVTRHAFASADQGGLDLRRLFVRIAVGNTGSLRVAERAGFLRSGTERQADQLRDGTWADMAMLDLLSGRLTS